VDGWRTDPEVPLQVRFGRGSADDARIGIDEGQILTLLWREACCRGRHHDKAVQRPISIGATYGSYAVITKGLTAHDDVIVGNLQKIAPGTPVRPTAGRPPAFGAVSDATDPG